MHGGASERAKICSTVQAHLQVGAIYYIVVSGYQADAGAYQINITAANGSFVPSLPMKGRYAVAQASSIAASGVTNSTVTGEVKAQMREEHDCHRMLFGACKNILPGIPSCKLMAGRCASRAGSARRPSAPGAAFRGLLLRIHYAGCLPGLPR